MARVSVTESEILEELRVALARIDTGANDAFTAHEMSDALGIDYKRLLVDLKRMKRAGQIEVVRVVRERIDGQRYTGPGYRIVKKVKARR